MYTRRTIHRLYRCELRNLIEALPLGCREEFENDEYIGKLWEKIFVLHGRSLTETIRRGDKDYDMVKNVLCPRILGKFFNYLKNLSSE